MPPLESVKELGQFLGLTCYYRKHINHCVNITLTLKHLQKTDASDH